MNITKIADKIEKGYNLMMYWDYNDKLTDEQVIKIIKEEDGLNDIENELYDYNFDYISEMITDRIKEYLDENHLILNEEEQDSLRLECENRFDFNIKGLLKNSETKIRITLLSNEDLIYYKDWEYTDTIKEFKKRFKGCFKVKDLKAEFDNLMNDYALITFFFKVKGEDILRLREQIQKGEITLRKGLDFGLFNSWIGGGSVLEIPLLKNITLNLKDWRFKNKKEEIIENLKKHTDYGYYSVEIVADELSSYGIQQVYMLSGEGWKEY